MADLNITFPARPIKLSALGTGIFSQLSAVLWSVVFAGGALFMVVPAISDLASDFSIRGVARPVMDAEIDGRCSGLFAFMKHCDVKLSMKRPGLPALRKNVYFWFSDFHIGNYTATVVSDPAQPEKMTIDLALDKLWNRVITLLFVGPFFLGIGYLMVMYFAGTLRTRRAVVRALSNQILRPTLLRLDHWTSGTWTVSGTTPTGDTKSWEWDTKRTPIFMDPAQNLVLAATTGDGTECLPLDTTLSWIDLTDTERAELFEKLGPERLRVRPAESAIRVGLARTATYFMVVAILFAAGTCTLAWFAFGNSGSHNLDYFTGIIITAGCGTISFLFFLLAILGYRSRKIA